LLSAIPIFNSILAVAAGMYGIGLVTFLFWSFLGKIGRNWLLILLVYQGYQRLS
jgi:membrane protein YqaA with SNARE-associated domain